MATRESVQLDLTLNFQVSLPKLEILRAFRHLNADSFARGKNTVEFATASGCDCACSIRLIVNNGIVTGYERDKCKYSTKVSANFAKRIKAAHAELTKRLDAPKWSNVPIADVVSSRSAAARLADIIISDGCVMVCWPALSGNLRAKERCFFCCWNEGDPFCMGPSEPTVSIGHVFQI